MRRSKRTAPGGAEQGDLGSFLRDPPSPAERLLTAGEVAQFLHISKITIYDWAQKGKIPAFRLGHHWRFRRADLEEWLDRNRRAPLAEEEA